MDKDDKVMRAYNRLAALRENIPNEKNWVIGRALVVQYDAALQHLTDAGFDIDEFRIASEFRDDDDGAVERALLLTQLDSVLGYFGSLRETEAAGRPVIGFRGPQKGA